MFTILVDLRLCDDVLATNSLFVRHFGSQRVVDPSGLGRLVPVAARANRLSRPFDSPQRSSGSKAPAAARLGGVLADFAIEITLDQLTA